MDNLELLKEFGLNKKEAKAYLASLELGSSSIGEIARKANIGRTHTYNVIESLYKKGLISKSPNGKRLLIRSTPPSKLLDILEFKKTTIKKELPSLEAIYNEKVNKPHVMFFEGTEGVQEIYDDMCRVSGSEVLAYASFEDFTMPDMKYCLEQVKKNHIKMRDLTVLGPKSKKYAEMKNYENIRVLPAKEFPPTDNIFYRGKVAYISLKPTPFGVLIEDENLYKTQKTIFEILWGKSEPFNPLG